MLGVAIRIAQRMGLHSERANAKCTALEAEMRRRLWWSLVVFEARIGELADYNTVMLAPTWDCRVPLNLNDSDLRPEMKELPAIQATSTEALFAVLRSEVGDFLRHAPFFLDFTNPALKPLASENKIHDASTGSGLAVLERLVEDKYLRFCDSDNPLHFMTMWTTRATLSRYGLMEYYSACFHATAPQSEAQRSAAVSHALSMLNCDTKIMTSPLTKSYRWFLHFYFPFIAYIHLVQYLKTEPLGKDSERAWEAMSANYSARDALVTPDHNPLWELLAKTVLQAWEPREALAGRDAGNTRPPPRIVSQVRQRMANWATGVREVDTVNPTRLGVGIGMGEFQGHSPPGVAGHDQFPGLDGRATYGLSMVGDTIGSGLPGQPQLDFTMSPLDWASLNSTVGFPGGW